MILPKILLVGLALLILVNASEKRRVSSRRSTRTKQLDTNNDSDKPKTDSKDKKRDRSPSRLPTKTRRRSAPVRVIAGSKAGELDAVGAPLPLRVLSACGPAPMLFLIAFLLFTFAHIPIRAFGFFMHSVLSPSNTPSVELGRNISNEAATCAALYGSDTWQQKYANQSTAIMSMMQDATKRDAPPYLAALPSTLKKSHRRERGVQPAASSRGLASRKVDTASSNMAAAKTEQSRHHKEQDSINAGQPRH